MKLVHSADLHLGFRAYSEITRAGVNQREVDVAVVFHRCIDAWIAIKPDLVCLAGDIFDKPRPTNPAIVHAMAELRRFRKAVPNAIVVVVAGNHDQSRTADAGSILPLFAEALGIHVVEGAATWLQFPERELAVLAVPQGAPAVLEPLPGFRRTVLVLHGGLQDVLPPGAPRSREMLTAADLGADRWTYVALGDYHVARDFGPNCGYSGSIEYTSTNIWGELAEEAERGLRGKSFVEFDLDAGDRIRHWIAPARLVLDLPAIDATELEAAAVNAALEAQVVAVPGGVAAKVVRQRVLNAAPGVKEALDKRFLSRMRGEATFYRFDVRTADRVRRELLLAEGYNDRRQSLEALVHDEIAKAFAKAFPDVAERDRAIAVGMDYFHEADAKSADTTEVMRGNA